MSNYIFRTTDEATLKRVQAEFEDYIGRETKITAPGELTVYSLPQRHTKRGEEEGKPQRITKREREEGIIPR